MSQCNTFLHSTHFSLLLKEENVDYELLDETERLRAILVGQLNGDSNTKLGWTN